MKHFHHLRALLRNWSRRRRVERDLKDELQAYADLVADEHRGRGADDEEAARRGRVTLGGIEPVAEVVRASRAGMGVDRLVQDVRYAIRGLRRSPGFAAMAVLTVGLGIGVSTTIFAIVDAAVFKPLPYRDPDRLVDIAQVRGRGTTSEARYLGLSWAQVDQWRAEPTLFEGIEVFGLPRRVKEIDGTSLPLAALGHLSPGIFQLLGIYPSIGRPFTDADLVPGPSALLLSDGYWRLGFGANRDVLGRTVSIEGQPHIVVGVMPATFRWGIGRGDLTIGWTLLDEQAERTANARKMNTGEIVRLRSGLTIEAAERELDAAALRLQAATPPDERWEVDLVPMDSRREHFADTRLLLFVFLAASGFVLLIPCANVANLLLARGLGRRSELAIRSALGATRLRIVRHLITEGLVLASLGGLAAVVLTWWSTEVIPHYVPLQLPLFAANPLETDGRVVAFCIAAVAATGVLCSVLPALRHSRHHAGDLANGKVRTAGARSRRRLSGRLLMTQVALALVLLCGHALLASSFIRLLIVDPGYRLDGLTRVVISVPPDHYSGSRAVELFDDLVARIRRLPGVAAVTVGSSPAGDLTARLEVEGQQTSPVADSLYVSADYFSAIGIPLTVGRAFAADDSQASPRVTIVSDSLAQAVWPGESPIGKRIRYTEYEEWTTVVGVARDIKSAHVAAGGLRHFQAYRPLTQDDGMYATSRSILFLADGDPSAVSARIADIVAAAEPAAAFTNNGEVAVEYSVVRQTPRVYLFLMSVMALLALTMATVGLYAATNYAVAGRAHEIGIRLALGANPRLIRRAVMADALRPVLAGASVGLVAAFWLTRLLTTTLYEVTPGDPLSMIAAVAVLMTAAVLGVLAPARRASRIDPAATLRTD